LRKKGLQICLKPIRGRQREIAFGDSEYAEFTQWDQDPVAIWPVDQE
jgi:hypothetical protein